METTRQRLLDLMQTRQQIAARELARLAHVTPADVRHHLRQLEREGLVRRTGRRLVEGRGRPAELFSLAHPASGLERLLEHLLDQALEQPDGLAELAGRLAPQSGDRGRHITQRLVAAMKDLAPLAYRPRWEAHPGGPQVIFENCPYAEIIADHPELCRMDARILERTLAEKVRQTEKLARSEEGVVVCRFVVENFV